MSQMSKVWTVVVASLMAGAGAVHAQSTSENPNRITPENETGSTMSDVDVKPSNNPRTSPAGPGTQPGSTTNTPPAVNDVTDNSSAAGSSGDVNRITSEDESGSTMSDVDAKPSNNPRTSTAGPGTQPGSTTNTPPAVNDVSGSPSDSAAGATSGSSMSDVDATPSNTPSTSPAGPPRTSPAGPNSDANTAGPSPGSDPGSSTMDSGSMADDPSMREPRSDRN